MSEQRMHESLVPEAVAQQLEVWSKSSLEPAAAERLKTALELAFQAHTGQFRDDGTPYIVHPLRTALVLLQEMGLRDPDLICTALLHDAIEDSPAVTFEVLSARCGEDVARRVKVLSKPPKEGRSHAEINAIYFPRITASPDEIVRMVKLADRLDNLRDLARCPEPRKRARMVDESRSFYLGLTESLSDLALRGKFRVALLAAIQDAEKDLPLSKLTLD